MSPEGKDPKKKKPYDPPSLKSDSVIESSTLACGKCFGSGPVGRATPQCKQFKRLS